MRREKINNAYLLELVATASGETLVTLRCFSERPLWAIADVRREAGLSDGVKILKHPRPASLVSATIGFPTFHEAKSVETGARRTMQAARH